MKKLFLAAIPFLVGTVPLSAQAEFMAYQSNLSAGNQLLPAAWAPLPISLRQDFSVNQAITVTSLGAFDSMGDGLSGPVTVGIFTRSGDSLISRELSGTAQPLSSGGNFRIYSLGLSDSLDLGAGDYSVVAWGYGGEFTPGIERNGNSLWGGVVTRETGGGLISFSDTTYYGLPSSSLEFPTNADGNLYSAGTFGFVAATPIGPAGVPIPGTLALAGLGVAAMGLRQRRKQ